MGNYRAGSVRAVVRSSTRVIDVALAPLAPLAAIVNLAVARWPKRMPLCTRIFDWFGTYPLRRHYHSPLVHPSDMRPSSECARTINGLDFNIEGQFALLTEFHYRDELLAIPRKKRDELSFGYDNSSFSAGDAEFLYNMIRCFKPRRLLEIGSGQSTLIARVAIAANERENAVHRCHQICVEPLEHPWLERTGVTVHRAKIEDLDARLVECLDPNDILFIDSSHVIRPQGDVLHTYLHLLGRLKPGVIVHVHDVFTPRDYPKEWILRERRLWNEQYLLEAFLCFNREFKVIGALNWLFHNHRERLVDACPVLLTEAAAEPGSFWMVRT